MKVSQFILFILLKSALAFSQTVTIPGDRSPAVTLPKAFRLINAEFQEGRILFVGEKNSKPYQFNIDLYLDKLVFINEKGDTLAIKDDASVRSAQIGKESFYHDIEKGYYKVLVKGDFISLVSKVVLMDISTPPSNAGYGSSSSGTTASVTVSKVKTDITLKKITNYFLLDRNGKLVGAYKRGFIRIFRKHEDAIVSFLKKENISFVEEKDLVKLFTFCISLDPKAEENSK